MSLKYLSKLISRIFDFYVWFPVMLLAGIFNSGLTPNQIKILLPTLMVVNVVIPTSYFFMDLAGRGISDIDVTKRQQRYHLFGRFVGICVISTIISYFLGNQVFFVMQLIGLMLAATIFLITFFYKISGHMILNVSSVFIVNFLFDWQYLWLFVIVPIVAFARINLKKHSVSQVLTGAALGLFVPLTVLKLFNLL